jgi:hypothetical protein
MPKPDISRRERLTGSCEQAWGVGLNHLARTSAGNHEIVAGTTLGAHQLIRVNMVPLGQVSAVGAMHLLNLINHFVTPAAF